MMVRQVGATLRPGRPPVTREELDEHWIHWTAVDVVDTVAASYSTWHADVVRAEIERRARYAAVPLTAVDSVVEASLAVVLSSSASIRLGPADEPDEPTGLRRRDGSSVFAVAGSQLYTCEGFATSNSAIRWTRWVVSEPYGPAVPGPNWGPIPTQHATAVSMLDRLLHRGRVVR